MADQKVSDLTATTTASVTDYAYLAKDAGAGVFGSVKITMANFFKWIWNTAQASPESSTNLVSGASVSLNFVTKVNVLTMTANGEIQLPDMSGWAAGSTMRIDLYVKQDATGSRDLTWATGWKSAAATLPTNTTDASAVDRFVVDCVKDLNICIVGLAQADLS